MKGSKRHKSDLVRKLTTDAVIYLLHHPLSYLLMDTVALLYLSHYKDKILYKYTNTLLINFYYSPSAHLFMPN